MDVTRAFTFLTDDPEWLPKLGIAAAVGFFSVIGLPLLLVGLVGWALLYGYQADLIRNVRDGLPRPLPRWVDYGGFLTRGANILSAAFVYNLPNILPACCIAFTFNFLGDGFIGSTVGLAVACCIVPLLLVYNLITAPMFALGLARYAEERNIVVFFQFGDLFDSVRRNFSASITWVVLNLIAGAVGVVLLAIPCLGWAVAPAVILPVQGHLVGQYANRLETPVRGRRPPR